QAEDGIRDRNVTGVQTCALPILADVRRRVIEPLTSTTEVVGTFDVRDRENYVYTAFHEAEREVMQQKAQTEPQLATTIGTGHSRSEERRVGKESRDGRAKEK